MGRKLIKSIPLSAFWEQILIKTKMIDQLRKERMSLHDLVVFAHYFSTFLVTFYALNLMEWKRLWISKGANFLSHYLTKSYD